jgi:hypothetical protein
LVLCLLLSPQFFEIIWIPWPKKISLDNIPMIPRFLYRMYLSKIKDHKKCDISFRSKTIPYQILSVFPVSLNNYFESLSSGNTMTLEESMSNNLLTSETPV